MQNKAKLFFETSIIGSWPLIPYQKAWSMLKKSGEKDKSKSIMYQKMQKMQNEPKTNPNEPNFLVKNLNNEPKINDTKL
jgi:hypothetical protein